VMTMMTDRWVVDQWSISHRKSVIWFFRWVLARMVRLSTLGNTRRWFDSRVVWRVCRGWWCTPKGPRLEPPPAGRAASDHRDRRGAQPTESSPRQRSAQFPGSVFGWKANSNLSIRSFAKRH